MSPVAKNHGDKGEREENGDLEKPLTPTELKNLRLLMRDVDRYVFTVIFLRNLTVGFAALVGVLYAGRELFGRLWKAIIQ